VSPTVTTASGTETSPAVGATLFVNVTCPAGQHALGGGGDITNANSTQDVFLDSSIPTGNPPTGWHAQAEQSALPVLGNNQWTLTTYVVCSP
jgi:hypothetical protein